ncbi:Co2+/Mg2+ efflux protein ApaG [Alteromonas marina]|uniref:Co2+/Mg2+ efflux protein ApaG n=1 Tax=unclassified Alteromonas TaxID=2614992 RepID=UPI0012E58C9C|nr:Co2+/Mg2+ efflux protein ApaG [Alteromonas sp. KUL150]GFD73260.1 protein ApaG [Tenacibaculum sp. KUL113]GFD85372.1 protein ApaG [Alteromonas sp. KUL150]|tara:strand:- start:584 stop:958 length:375 start_codon:yes stop_codon:yes gene_type:complete
MDVLDIKVRVKTRHLPEHLPSDSKQFAFAYHITIENNSDKTVQLINRYWKITDADGKTSEVQGAGVVGKQPILKAGEQFEYTSGAVIDTPVGNMEGYYEMELEDGERFRLPIDIFRLAIPSILH